MFLFIDRPALVCRWVNFPILWPHTLVQMKLKCSRGQIPAEICPAVSESPRKGRSLISVYGCVPPSKVYFSDLKIENRVTLYLKCE